MPDEVAETRPLRRFRGEGVVDSRSRRAGVTYDLSEIPNSAGFYGHVEREMTVVYAGDRFTLTFPQLQTALEGPLDWVAYELDDLSIEQSYELGIGQLREIGLGDPQVAVALLLGGPAANLTPRGLGSIEGTTVSEYAFESDIGRAVRVLGGEGPDVVLDTLLRQLDVGTVLVRVAVDGDGLARRITWSASYTHGPGVRGRVGLRVAVSLAPKTDRSTVARPQPNQVVVWEKQLSR